MLGSTKANMVDSARKGRLWMQQPDAFRVCKRGHALAGGNVYIHPVTGRRSCHSCILWRNAQRSADHDGRILRTGRHRPVPTDDHLRCATCGRHIHRSRMGRHLDWRHSRSG